MKYFIVLISLNMMTMHCLSPLARGMLLHPPAPVRALICSPTQPMWVIRAPSGGVRWMPGVLVGAGRALLHLTCAGFRYQPQAIEPKISELPKQEKLIEELNIYIKSQFTIMISKIKFVTINCKILQKCIYMYMFGMKNDYISSHYLCQVHYLMLLS